MEPRGAIPTSVRFIEPAAEPPSGGGEVEPLGRGGALVEVPAGGGVELPGATPMSVFFMEAAGDDVVLVDVPVGAGVPGDKGAPQVLHSAVSGLAGTPHRGHEIISADYFSCSQNAMA